MRLEPEDVVGREDSSMEGEGEAGGAEAGEDEQVGGGCAPQFIGILLGEVRE